MRVKSTYLLEENNFIRFKYQCKINVELFSLNLVDSCQSYLKYLSYGYLSFKFLCCDDHYTI